MKYLLEFHASASSGLGDRTRPFASKTAHPFASVADLGSTLNGFLRNRSHCEKRTSSAGGHAKRPLKNLSDYPKTIQRGSGSGLI